MSASTRPGGVVRFRNFRLLWLGETTSSVGSSITGVALPLVALSTLHAGVLAVSLISAAAWLPWLVVGLPAGAWVDRLRRRPVLIGADVVSLVAFASVPLSATFGVLTIAQLVAVAFGAGTANVFFSAAYRAFVPLIVPAGDLLEANAKLQGSEQVARVAGPGIAGLIAQAASAVAGVTVDAASFAVSAFCLLRMRVRETPVSVRDGAPRRLRSEIAEGLRFVLHDPYLRVMALFGGVANLLLLGYQSILVVFLVDVVGLPPGPVGLLIAATSLGGVAGALVARRLATSLGTARALLLTKMVVTPFGLLIPLAARGPELVLFVLGSTVVIAGIVAGNIIWEGFMQVYCPPSLLGRVTTSTRVVNYGTMPVGAVLGGVLADVMGVRSALWVILGAFAASSLILLIGPLHRHRYLPTRTAEPSAPAGTIRV